MFEREYRELSFVPRWSVLRNIRQQNVAEHCFYVALYAGQVADLINWGGNRGDLYKAALLHDLGEAGMGDWPGPAKRRVSRDRDSIKDVIESVEIDYIVHAFDTWALIDTPPDVKAIIRVADMLDAILFLLTDKQMGNSTIGSIYDGQRVTPASQLYKNLQDAWSKMVEVLKLDPIILERVFRMDVYPALDDAEHNDSYIIRNP